MSLSRLQSRIRAARHKAFVRLFAHWMPYYLVNEFPKSGGTWLAEMLAEALNLPFRRNQPIRLERSVTHGHFLNPLGITHKTVVVWRDPRDLLVSYYHHCYFINEHHNAPLVQVMKKRLPFGDYQDVRGNLPAFIRFLSTEPVSPPFTWSRFANVWLKQPGVVHTKYESLREDTPGELTRILRELTGERLLPGQARTVADNHSLARARQRASALAPKRKVEVSFVREGALGGWQRYFSNEAMREMEGYQALMWKLGYR